MDGSVQGLAAPAWMMKHSCQLLRAARASRPNRIQNGTRKRGSNARKLKYGNPCSFRSLREALIGGHEGSLGSAGHESAAGTP